MTKLELRNTDKFTLGLDKLEHGLGTKQLMQINRVYS
jgi:hypothetical protein